MSKYEICKCLFAKILVVSLAHFNCINFCLGMKYINFITLSLQKTMIIIKKLNLAFLCILFLETFSLYWLKGQMFGKHNYSEN